MRAEGASTVVERYAYRSEQASLLRPLYLRVVWEPLLRRIPTQVPANTLTLVGTACALLAFVLPTLLRGSRLAAAASSLLVLCYLTLDNLDGMQATRAGSSSPRGEFLDHWLDAANTGFVVLGVCASLRADPAPTLVALAAANLSYFAVHWSHRHTRVLRLGLIADIEGATAASLLHATAAGPGVGLVDRPLAPGLNGIWLLALGLVVQAVWTSASAALSVRSAWLEWGPTLALTGGVLAWHRFGELWTPASLALLVAGSVLCGGRQVVRRLTRLSGMPSDWLAAGLVVAAAAASVSLGSASQGWLASAAVLVLTLLAARDGWIALRSLR